MIGIFLLLCLFGIAVLWTVVGIVALRKRWVARREQRAMLHAHAEALAARQRIYDEARKTSLTSVLDQLAMSASLVLPVQAEPPTSRTKAWSWMVGALRGLRTWSRAVASRTTNALRRLRPQTASALHSARAIMSRLAARARAVVGAKTRAFVRGMHVTAIRAWRFLAPQLQRLLTATASRAPRTVKALVRTESTLVMWPPPIPHTSPTAHAASPATPIGSSPDAAVPRVPIAPARASSVRTPPPPFRRSPQR